MFKFLKDKLKKTISSFSKKVDEVGEEKVDGEVEEIIKETEKPKQEEKKGFLKKLFKKKEEKIIEEDKEIEKEEKIIEEEKPKEEPEAEEIQKEVIEKIEKEETKIIEKEVEKKEAVQEEVKEEQKEIIEEKEEEKPKKGFFQRIHHSITTKKINEKQFEDIFWDLETALLENNVALEVIEKIKEDLKQNIVEKPLPRSKIEQIIEKTLSDSIKDLFRKPGFDLIEKIKEKTEKPHVICFLGINGSGKTTTIAKIARMLMDNKLSVVLAASDTFRAAAIDQIQIHADKLGIKLIKHDYGSDPAAVAFDAVKHAKAKGIDVVLIDTAGRMHSNTNLTDEMKKIVRVAKPDLKIFVGESITGNDCVEQAKKFDEAVEIDAIILAKADVDEKGGAAVSVSYVTGKPIIYIGTGQEYSDIKKFDSGIVVEGLGLA